MVELRLFGTHLADRGSYRGKPIESIRMCESCGLDDTALFLLTAVADLGGVLVRLAMPETRGAAVMAMAGGTTATSID